jgi:hypothetical protein
MRPWCPNTHLKPKGSENGLLGPMTARVHASCTKQLVLLFFVSMHIIPMDITIDANYTMVVLDGELVYVESLISRCSQSYVCVYSRRNKT